MVIEVNVEKAMREINIGKQGENLVTTIQFDCTEWLEGLESGSLSIMHKRPTDEEAYPCANTVYTDTEIDWTVNSTDLAYAGTGLLEIRYMLGEVVAKSQTFRTIITQALAPMDEPPEPYIPYINAVADAATQEMENMMLTFEPRWFRMLNRMNHRSEPWAL